MYLHTIEERIDRLQMKRASELRTPTGAADAAAIAMHVSYLDGKIDALMGVWEDATGRAYDRHAMGDSDEA